LVLKDCIISSVVYVDHDLTGGWLSRATAITLADFVEIKEGFQIEKRGVIWN